MNKPVVLWVDLRFAFLKPSPCSAPTSQYIVKRITDVKNIPEEIAKVHPKIICFEYDFPDTAKLLAFQKTKRCSPSIPVIVLTEQHTESLAVWVFRSGGREYIIKPIEDDKFKERILTITTIQGDILDKSRENIFIPEPIPQEFQSNKALPTKTHEAKSYIEKHFSEKVYIEDVAKRCNMSTSTFSKLFKKEHGQGFSEYLTRYRINQARKLFATSSASVTDVAYAVGFHDHSYFTRIFKRYVGIPPSEYCNNIT